MNNREKWTSGIVLGFAAGVTAAFACQARDERKFEPSLKEKAKALDAKITRDGAQIFEQVEKVKHDAERIAKEKSNT